MVQRKLDERIALALDLQMTQARTQLAEDYWSLIWSFRASVIDRLNRLETMVSELTELLGVANLVDEPIQDLPSLSILSNDSTCVDIESRVSRTIAAVSKTMGNGRDTDSFAN